MDTRPKNTELLLLQWQERCATFDYFVMLLHFNIDLFWR